jgi:hypothetical protein
MKPPAVTGALTLSVLLLGAIILIVWDVIAALNWGYEATISCQTLRVSQQHPIIPLALGLVTGLLFGHLFWSQ